MSRTSLSALALLALLAVLTVGVVATSHGATDGSAGDQLTVSSIPNTTNYLSIDAPERQSHLRSDVDVVAAAGISAQRLHARHANRTFDRRFDSEGTDGTDRVEVLRGTATRVEGRLDRVDARQAALFRSYSNGSISRETFLRRLGRLTARAQSTRGHLQHARTRVDTSLETTLPVSLDTRITAIQTQLVTLPHPLSDRLQASLTGRRDPVVVYAEGSDGGLVAGTVDGGEFVRQATLRTDYAPDSPDEFDQPDQQSITTAFERGGELYSWAYGNAIGGPQIRGFGGTSVYLVAIDHPQGSLRSYISGGTRDAFHEIQRQRPGAVPVTDTTSRTNNSMQLAVEQTSQTGPMRVVVTQPSTGAPLDATVLVDGQYAGRTGTDGQLWTVQPSGEARVNATTDGNSVVVSVS